MKSNKRWAAKDRGVNITRLMARDGTDCKLCGQPLDRRISDHLDPNYVTFDHIKPLSIGGLSRPDNLQLAHRKCNNDRGAEY